MSQGRGIGAIQAGQAFIQLSLNDKDFKKNLHGARIYMDQWGKTLTKVGATMALAGGGMLAGFAAIVKQVANLESAFRRFDLMFGKLAGSMTNELQKISDVTGMPISSLKEQASAFGAIFAEMREEITDEQYVKLVGQTMQSVVDLVGLAGISMEEAADRIKSGFTSTGEALDQFGINLRKANLEAEGARLGMKGNVLTWSEQQKQLLKLSIMQRQTARTGITFARVADTINAQLAIMKANFKELLARMIGFLNRALVPVLRAMNALLRVMRPLATVFAPLLTMMGLLGGGLLVGGGILTGLGLLIQLTSIAIGGWLKLTRLILDFGRYYAAVQALLASTGAINVATAAWARLAAAIALVNRGLSMSGILGLLRKLPMAALGVAAGAWMGKQAASNRIFDIQLGQLPFYKPKWGRTLQLRDLPPFGLPRELFKTTASDLLGKFSGLGDKAASYLPEWYQSFYKKTKDIPMSKWMSPLDWPWADLISPTAKDVAKGAAFAPIGVAGTFQPGMAQQLAFGTSASGVEQTNSLLGGLSELAGKVIQEDKVKVSFGLL